MIEHTKFMQMTNVVSDVGGRNETKLTKKIFFRILTRLQKRAGNGVELKPIVFALFSQNEKSAT